jgi:hypothetical protein
MIIVNNSYHCEQHVHNMANVIEHEGFDLDNQACMQALKKVCPGQCLSTPFRALASCRRD